MKLKELLTKIYYDQIVRISDWDKTYYKGEMEKWDQDTITLNKEVITINTDKNSPDVLEIYLRRKKNEQKTRRTR